MANPEHGGTGGGIMNATAGKGVMRFPLGTAALLLSAALHAGIIGAVLTVLVFHVRTADVVQVHLINIQGMPARQAGQSAPAARRGHPSPVRSEAPVGSAPDSVTPSGAAVPDAKGEPPVSAVPGGAAPSGAPIQTSAAGSGQGGAPAGPEKGDSGAGTQGSGAANATDLQAYHAAVLARIEAAKRYPPPARRRRQEGSVKVAFTLSRAGGLLDLKIAASSGVACLDQAAMAAVRDGGPYPGYPGNRDGSTIPMTVNVDFALQR